MAWVWNWLGALGLLAAGVAFVLAWFVWAARPGRLQNVALALTLVFEGSNHLFGSGLMYFTNDPREVFSIQVMTLVFAYPQLGSYLVFLTTLESPWVRRFRGTVTRVLLGATGALLVVPVFLWTDRFVAGVRPFAPYAEWNAEFGPWAIPLAGVTFVWLGAIALAVSVSAMLAAPRGSPARDRARHFTIAFAIRDVGYLLVFGLAATSVSIVGELDLILLPPLVPLLYLPIFAYGILRQQLFDIDLRIKWTLSRGTVAAAFIAAFFVASELASNLLSERLGVVSGVLAAGLLVFAIAPLQRVADRVADRAMPRVQDTDEYRLVRRRDVYRAAVEGALADGSISDRERDVLARLQDELGLSGTDARTIEREVAALAR